MRLKESATRYAAGRKSTDRPARRAPWALAVLGAAMACGRGGEAPPARPAESAPPAATATDPPSDSADIQRLVGRWMRSDWDYMIWIKSASPDGTLDVEYRNPGPIHVSRAEARREEGEWRILVQMSDRNYPGSYYTLSYDPGSDTLYGVYHQLVQNQQFEVSFRRLEKGAEELPVPR